MSDAPLTESPEKPADAAAPPDLADEEVDVWWGGYFPWTMLPSFAACALLTGAIAWLTWLLVPREYFRVVFLGLTVVLWAAQVLRWAYRSAAYTYRLTTHRLFKERGFLFAGTDHVRLEAVVHVIVRKGWMERLLRVGRVQVYCQGTSSPLVLEGVRDTGWVAETIRARVQKAKARKETTGPAA